MTVYYDVIFIKQSEVSYNTRTYEESGNPSLEHQMFFLISTVRCCTYRSNTRYTRTCRTILDRTYLVCCPCIPRLRTVRYVLCNRTNCFFILEQLQFVVVAASSDYYDGVIVTPVRWFKLYDYDTVIISPANSTTTTRRRQY